MIFVFLLKELTGFASRPPLPVARTATAKVATARHETLRNPEAPARCQHTSRNTSLTRAWSHSQCSQTHRYGWTSPLNLTLTILCSVTMRRVQTLRIPTVPFRTTISLDGETTKTIHKWMQQITGMVLSNCWNAGHLPFQSKILWVPRRGHSWRLWPWVNQNLVDH